MQTVRLSTKRQNVMTMRGPDIEINAVDQAVHTTQTYDFDGRTIVRDSLPC